MDWKSVHRQNCNYLKFCVSKLSDRRRPLRPHPVVRGRHVDKATRYEMTHLLNLPQFFGSCMIARAMKVGAENCIKKMRQYPNSKLTTIHAWINVGLMHPKSNTPNARRLKLSIQRQSLQRPVRKGPRIHLASEFATPSAQSSKHPFSGRVCTHGLNGGWRRWRHGRWIQQTAELSRVLSAHGQIEFIDNGLWLRNGQSFYLHIDRSNYRQIRGRSGPEMDQKQDLVLRFFKSPFRSST